MKLQIYSAIAIAGSVLGANGQLFVTTTLPNGPSTIGEYTASGEAINASFISGSSGIESIAADGGGNLYAAYLDAGEVLKYAASGARVNDFLILVPNHPADVALDGSGNLYVVDDLKHIVGKYTTSGATVNAKLISNLPVGGLGWQLIACDGTYLYLGNSSSTSIAKYTLSGTLVDASLITLPVHAGPLAMTCDNSGHLFVARGDDVVSEYGTDGSTINASLIPSVLTEPRGIALDGNGHLFVSSERYGTVSEYTTAGQLIDLTLISGLSEPGSLVFVPEPGIATMVLVGCASGCCCMINKRRQVQRA